MSLNNQTRILAKLSEEHNIRIAQVIATVQMLDDGASVPFIARYRKEATGGLDDNVLRSLEERLSYLRELEERRAAILQSIDEQGKLTAELATEINTAETKQRLEDLYLPYKQKRRTKAQIAREAGIEPLALSLLNEPNQEPLICASNYLNVEAGFADAKAVLDGAKQILMEQFAENAELVGDLRQYLFEHGYLQARVIDGKEQEGENYRDWFDYAEAIADIPSHRALAILRGRNENILQVKLILDSELNEEEVNSLSRRQLNPCELRIATVVGVKDHGRSADAWLLECVRWTWRVKLQAHLELELINQLKNNADEEAIAVFARNLKNLLLAAPAGNKVTMGLDPGIRTGVKAAIIDAQGKLLDTATIYPHEPRCDWHGSLQTIAALCAHHDVKLIAIGNGTASRETDKLVGDLIKQYPKIKINKIVVSEAGASVYSASEFAAKEFPELDVSLRGAVSIARRLQDPLAELVKIDPKSIGVGQYQHDVSQSRLAKSLQNVVEDCVNAVGVDVNTASIPLLTAVSGLNNSLASNIVHYRDSNGPFISRQSLKQVPRLGEKTYEQAVGFLRINGGENPLDASAVHPEAYPVVEDILSKLGKTINELMGNKTILEKISPEKFINQQFGLPTVKDILRELEKPGRDPRPEFKTATFTDGIDSIKDLRPGMLLEGVITNVANFGAFVDIGVHQDGLLHISALSYQFIKDPSEIVKTGEIVKVKVIEVDVARARISLTMRLNDPLPSPNLASEKSQAARNSSGGRKNQADKSAPSNFSSQTNSALGGAMSEAFSRLKK